MALIGFAVPVVASFGLDAAFATSTGDDAGSADPDLLFGNQMTPGSFFSYSNQGVPEAFFPNQVFANQYYPNQFQGNQNTAT